MVQEQNMNILVANDDGIEAEGLNRLVLALHEEAGANVYVFAPESQRSAASHAISLRGSVDVWPVEYPGAEMAHAVAGTPADCVAVGLKIMKEKDIPIDMVYAGINHGSNVGTDTVYSGTVGAATEGSIQGYPSVAVSVDSHHAKHFDYACSLACDVIKKTGGKWDSDIMLNINTPDKPAEDIKGVRYTVIGEREYINDICLSSEKDGVSTYVYGGEAVRYQGKPESIDVIAIQEGYASITPVRVDMTASEAVSDLERWRIGK